MKQSKLFHVLFPFIIMCIPWIYLAVIWNDLPAIVPTHFNINGVADEFSPKNKIVIGPAVLTVMGICIYFILHNIHKIDPRKKYSETTAGILAKIAVMMIILLCGVTLFILYWSVKGKVQGLNIFLCGISLFMAYIGNLLHSVKPNYFAGFRLPWTLENEDNWRKTHQLASKVWFIGGIALAILSLILNYRITIIVFFVVIMLMTFTPIIYSYKLYKKSLKEKA
jgi:uncharacterized membrane protein